MQKIYVYLPIEVSLILENVDSSKQLQNFLNLQFVTDFLFKTKISCLFLGEFIKYFRFLV